MKLVIEGDTMTCLEKFYKKNTGDVVLKYRNDGRWNDVQVDADGDIILWED